MTGDINLDAAMLVLAAILGALGSSFGWPVLTRIADWIKARDTKPETKNGTPQPAPLRADAHEVAGPAWLSILLPFISTLVPLILDLIAKFRQQNGREPTRQEVRQIIQAAHQAAEDGRVHAVLLDDPMPERDLERVASGKETIGRANRTLDTIDAAARNLGTAARSGDDLFRQGSRFLGS